MCYFKNTSLVLSIARLICLFTMAMRVIVKKNNKKKKLKIDQ